VSIDCENNGNVILAVKDSGTGISEDKLKDLFNQFTKTSKSGTDGERGTGLGLSIIKNLVEKHKGVNRSRERTWQGFYIQSYIPQVLAPTFRPTGNR
jgi:signal transduction histidine kinase